MPETSPLIVAAAGDVFLNRPHLDDVFDPLEACLAAAHFRFANNEGVYSDTTERAPSAGFPVIAPQRAANGLKPAHFDVMSCANNHTLDAGHRGLADTLRQFEALGIESVGAGIDRMAARSPVFREVKGRRIAVLAYTSVLQPGYEAQLRVPGVAVLHAHSVYYHADWDPYGRLEPGSAPQVRTFPFPEDLEEMRDEIRLASEHADIVLVSCHWGDSRRPAFIHDYELAYGRAAIDAGAHAVFGHHHHFLRGAELYRGRPIFYGLGHLVFDLIGLDSILDEPALQRLKSLGDYAIYPRSDPTFPFHEDARMTALAYCEFEGEEVRATLLPCYIGTANIPVPCSVDGKLGAHILDYLREITREAGLDTQYETARLPVHGFIGIGFQQPEP